MSTRKEVFHMPWWLWIPIVPLLIILLAHVDSWLSGYKSEVKFQDHNGAKNGTLIVYLPGLIADGEDSSQPLMNTWLEQGDVVTVSYTGERFDATDVVESVIWRLRADVGHDKFVFIGSSMGGMLAIDIINQLRHDGSLSIIKASSIIFVDSPSGSADMLGGGNIVAPVLRLLPFGRVLNGVITYFLHKGFVPPKDQNIEPQLNKDLTKSEALKSMRKFPASVWRDQLAYMAGHAKPQPSDFAGLDRVVYLKCDRVIEMEQKDGSFKAVQQNETVKQPQASEIWRNAARGMLVIDVDSTHCGYLERPLIWNEQFKLILQSMNTPL